MTRRCRPIHTRLVLQQWRFELVPEESDLRPVGLITQRLRRVVGTLTKREAGDYWLTMAGVQR